MTGAALIKSDQDMQLASARLCALEPRFAHVIDLAGPPPLRRRPDGFAAVASAIISQQVSVASANAIRNRLETAGFMEPQAILSVSQEDLRAVGLSKQKATYFKSLAEAGIDFDALRSASDEDVIATLTSVKGIGQWTAQIYVMFSLGRPDVFPQADLALQESARLLFSLPERPAPKALAQLAQNWAPWRSVAAVMLWHYYRHMKNREGI